MLSVQTFIQVDNSKGLVDLNHLKVMFTSIIIYTIFLVIARIKLIAHFNHSQISDLFKVLFLKT